MPGMQLSTIPQIKETVFDFHWVTGLLEVDRIFPTV